MMVAVLLSFKYKPDQYSEQVGKTTASAAVAFFFLFMLFFGAAANCIPWVYVVSIALSLDWLIELKSLANKIFQPEILPLHARAKGTAVAISANWLWVRLHLIPDRRNDADRMQNFVVVMIAPSAIANVSIPVVCPRRSDTNGRSVEMESLHHLYGAELLLHPIDVLLLSRNKQTHA